MDETIEQPQLESEEPIDEIDNSALNQEGSIFGKFKNASNLIDAYNNLQAEFTRKSQKLAEYQKENEKNSTQKNYQSIEEFFNDLKEDEKYKKEVTEILANDTEICNLPNKFQIALKIAKVTDDKLTKNLNDPDFIDKYVTENNLVKDKILSNYLSNLNNISQAPKVLTGNSSNVYFAPITDKPKTLKEASEIFQKMLK